MFEPELLAALLPATDPPVATFREVLGILQKMAEFLPLDTRPCRFTPATYRAWQENSARYPERHKGRAEFVQRLSVAIRERAKEKEGEVWKPKDADEWLTFLQMSPAPDKYTSKSLGSARSS